MSSDQSPVTSKGERGRVRSDFGLGILDRSSPWRDLVEIHCYSCIDEQELPMELGRCKSGLGIE